MSSVCMVFTRFEQSGYIGGQSSTTEICISFLAVNFETLVRVLTVLNVGWT